MHARYGMNIVRTARLALSYLNKLIGQSYFSVLKKSHGSKKKKDGAIPTRNSKGAF